MNSPTQASAQPAIVVCVNRRLGHDKPSCAARGSEAIADALDATLRKTGVSVVRIKCFGRCAEGPNARIAGGQFFRGIGLADVPAILGALQTQILSLDSDASSCSEK
jgi:NADH:ubiquinone oxidoreductase subunit E